MTDQPFDPFDPAFIACPFPTMATLRAECPVAHVADGRGFWFVTRHDLVREAVTDTATFSSEVGSLSMMKPSPELLARIREVAPRIGNEVHTLLTLDPPGHTRNRRLVSRAFTPLAVRAYEPLARAVSRELIDAWRDGEVHDFVRSFAVPLPVRVIAAGLAVPDDRVDDFKRWSDAAVAPIGARLSDDEMVESDDLKHVMVLLEKMDTREATVLRMRFGLNDEEPKTLKEIGECLGLTRERVRQIESEALAKLNVSLCGES